jgi:hypothetical protein
LASAINGSERSASRSGRLTPDERVPGTHLTERPRADRDDADRREISCLWRESNSSRLVRGTSLYQMSYPGRPILVSDYYSTTVQDAATR